MRKTTSRKSHVGQAVACAVLLTALSGLKTGYALAQSAITTRPFADNNKPGAP